MNIIKTDLLTKKIWSSWYKNRTRLINGGFMGLFDRFKKIKKVIFK